MSEMNRRGFVAAAAAATVSLAVLNSAEQLLAQVGPAPAGSTTVDVGKPEDFARDSISTKFATAEKVLIANAGGKIYAMTAVCTHRKSTINSIRDGKFRCPSHGSIFGIDGKVVSGQAKGSLVRFAIKLDEKGNLIVDKTRTFDEAKWDDPQASYTVKA